MCHHVPACCLHGQGVVQEHALPEEAVSSYTGGGVAGGGVEMGKNNETHQTDVVVQLKALKGLDAQLRDLASEILCAIAKLLEDDLNTGLTRLKKRAPVKLDAFAERAAVPISAALKGAKSLEVMQLPKQLPELRGYIEVLKKELCEDALRKRITKGLMGAASKPLQGVGYGAEQTLALSVKFEQHLNKKLEELKKVDEAAQKLLRRHLPEGSLRARAFEVSKY